MKLTVSQSNALLDAYKNDGQIFQSMRPYRHAPVVLNKLVNDGLLKKEPVGTVWTLTDAGREVLKTVY